MCYGFNQECDNNIKKKSIFEGITLHKCSIYIKEVNSFPLHHSIVFSNLHIKHQIKPNVHLIINYIRKDNEKLKNNVNL
jgi:hypothetical protein